MGEVVNLRRVRKELRRAAEARDAEANRAKHGRTRADRDRADADRAAAARLLDGARLVPSDRDGEAGE